MRGILKIAGMSLTALFNLSVLADDGEIYTAQTSAKPQVLIILDTSRHMKKKDFFPFPARYDPHINYLDPPAQKTERYFHDLFTSKYFYYNNSEAIDSLLPHENLVEIAAKEKLTDAEQLAYNKFVATIPDHNKGTNKIKFRYMNCASAMDDFNGDLGANFDRVGQWNGIYGWDQIGGKSAVYPKVDCAQDISSNNPHNPGAEQGALFPATNKESGNTESVFYQGFPDNAWYNVPVGYKKNDGNIAFNAVEDNTYLYSQNLVKWADLKNRGGKELHLSYLNYAKKVVLDVMLKTPGLEVGLEIFNMNNTVFEKIDLANNHGGRIIAGIQSYEKNELSKTDYQNKVNLLRNKLKDTVTTNYSRAALCESVYEAYRYLYGLELKFGREDYFWSKPKVDHNIFDGSTSKYKSPLDWGSPCRTEAYIIIISAGYHDADKFFKCNDHDGEVDSEIDKLTAELAAERPDLVALDDDEPQSLSNNARENRKIKSLVNSRVNKTKNCTVSNYLPALSFYLYNNDMNKLTTKRERIATYTVGMGELSSGSHTLLQKTAIAGGGQFYHAVNASKLREKLQMVLADIQAKQQATTAAMVTSVSSVNAARSNDTVYVSMFEANQTSRWKGNLKKFKIQNGILSAWNKPVGSGEQPQFTAALSSVKDSFFNNSLYSGWSSEKGLNNVSIGGVVESLKKRSVADNPRVIYVKNAADSTLLPLNKSNLKLALGVSSVPGADPGAKPKEKGNSSKSSAEGSDDAKLAELLGVSVADLDASVRWLQGLNDTGDSYRSDIMGDPMHSTPVVVQLNNTAKPRIFMGTNAGFFHAFKDNGASVEEEWAFIPTEMLRRAFALRGTTQAKSRIYGIDGSPVDVEYTENGSTKHMITFGLRRGGSAYYGLKLEVDEADVTTPKLAWIISDTGDFAELGQSWSTPVVTRVYQGTGNPANDQPVLIFGGGYDPDKDNCKTVGDASCTDDEGRSVYIVNAITGTLVKAFTGDTFKASIGSKLATLDSDGDGYTDRIYAPDTAGNIYRIDMPFSMGDNNAVLGQWSVMTLATLGSGSLRRFFNPPSIVRTRDINGLSYDGLLIGSGDITKPNSSSTTQNYFFNIKDTNIYPVVWGPGETTRPSPIELENLTSVSYSSGEKSDSVMAVAKGDKINGWKYKLTEASVLADDTVVNGGEKSLGSAVVINGMVHFNSYTPFSSEAVIADGQCVLNQSGNSHYYQLKLHTGTTELYRKLPNVIARDLAVHAASKRGAPVLRILGAGKGDEITLNDVDGSTKVLPTGTVDTKVSMLPRSVYHFFNESVK